MGKEIKKVLPGKTQLSFEIPQIYRREDVPVDKIIITGDYEESFYNGVYRSASFFRNILQGVLLVENGEAFDIGFGLRRVLAARQAHLETVPALIFPSGTPKEVLSSFIVAENMSRRPNPATEAESLSIIMLAYGWEPSDVFKNLGVPSAHVSSRIKLLKLIPEFFQRLKEGRLSLAAAKKLCDLERGKQMELAEREALTLEIVEEAVKEKKRSSFIPADLFKMPGPAANEEKVADLISEATSRIERAIEITTNGVKGDLSKILKVLKKVQDKTAEAA